MDNFNSEESNKKHQNTKKILKIVGLILLVIGVICDIIGGIDFFIAFAKMKMPKLFFMLFIGMPLTFFGGASLALGFLGEVTKYQSKEVKPAAKYMAKGVADVVEGSVSVIKKESIRCPFCDEENDKDARFCNSCGKPLKRICPSCGSENDGDSKYCDNCGKEL